MTMIIIWVCIVCFLVGLGLLAVLAAISIARREAQSKPDGTDPNEED
jgi:hypothetical protein